MAAPSVHLLQPALPLNPTTTGATDGSRIKEVSRQLESQFAQMMIKCMREASFGDSLFPGENQMFRDMYDQQLAQAMSQGKGLGLAPMIERQLGGQAAAAVPLDTAISQYRGLQSLGVAEAAGSTSMLDAIAGRTQAPAREEPATALFPASWQRQAPTPACDEVEQVAQVDPNQYAARTPERFVSEIWPHAQQAARELGVDPRALVAQAALETGWGRRVIQRNDGGSAHNLFGIKATGWNGDAARTTTHEYRGGIKQTETASFRAYASPAESFADYVRLLKTSPRYQQALAAGTDISGFASGLQKAGYATDPTYANKIAAIAHGPTLGRVLGAMDAVSVASTTARSGALSRR